GGRAARAEPEPDRRSLRDALSAHAGARDRDRPARPRVEGPARKDARPLSDGNRRVGSASLRAGHARSALHVDAPDPRRARAGRRRAGRPQERGRALPRGVSVFRTALCELLAIEYPIVQSGMGGVAGLEPRLAEACHRRGIKVMAMVSTVDDARTAARDGADVIVAQGGEAGGHRSVDGKPASPEATTVGLMALLPQVVDAVRVPVVAAG